MERPRILITGAPGILGTNFTRRLVADGYEVETASLLPWEDAPSVHWQVDLCSFGETVELIKGYDAVLHLAAVNKEGVRTPAKTFEINALSTFNVFYAAHLNGVRRVVWASSCHTGGGQWIDGHAPRKVPISESDTYLTGDTYGLSKLVGEHLTLNERAWPGMSICGIRYGYVYKHDEYEILTERWKDPEHWAHNLWNYIDDRDAYELTRLALTEEYTGGHILYATARDQKMNIPTRTLVERYFPGTEIADGTDEFGSLISGHAARELLGFEPQHSWRESLSG